jgi:hypothetical protein
MEMAFRRRWIWLAVLALTLGSCAVLGSDSKEEPIPGDLFGSWQWVQSEGGFGGVRMTPETEGYTQKLTFMSPRSFILYRNNDVFDHGTFSAQREDDGTKLHFSSSKAWTTDYLLITLVESDSLVLQDWCFDCFSHTYRRIDE